MDYKAQYRFNESTKWNDLKSDGQAITGDSVGQVIQGIINAEFNPNEFGRSYEFRIIKNEHVYKVIE